jgi:hypothetical protein
MNKRLLTLLAFVAVVALAALWASPRDSEATVWNPRFVATDFYTLLPSTPSAFSQTRAQFNVDPQSANFTALFGGAMTFGDAAVHTGTDADIPTGASIGQLTTVAQLGLSNGACNTPTPVTFDFVDASTSGTIISPAGPSTNLLANYAEDDGDLNNDQQTLLFSPAAAGATSIIVTNAANFRVGDDLAIGGLGTNPEKNVGWIAGVNPTTRTITLTSPLANAHNANEVVATPDVFAFAFNGIPDGADAYPSFISESLDPDGPGPLPSVTPRARYYANAFVASTLIVTLQFVIFELGQLTAFPNLGWAGPSWGFASTTFLQDPVAPPSNSAISDFCNFTSNTRFSGLSGDNTCTPLTALTPAECFGAGAGFTLRLAARNGCTQLRDNAAAGATSIVVQVAQGLAAGNTIRIGGSPSPISGGETKTIASVTPIAGGTEATVGLTSGLASARSSGALVDRTNPARTSVDECAFVRSQNPATAQSVRYYQYAVSQRDADNDGAQYSGCNPCGPPGPANGPGIENGLDPCPFTANPNWNPRTTSGPTNDDNDGDGLPDGCDPNDSGKSCTGNTDPQDEDCDGWKNRLDQCPLIVNGNRVTTLTANAAAGATSVTVASTTGFNVGDLISISQADVSTTPPQIFEDPVRTVTGISGNTITFTPALNNSYTTGGGARPQPAAVNQTSHAQNTNQFDRDIPPGQSVPDGGPASDSISPECDPNPNATNGHYHATAASFSICIGAPAAPQSDDCTTADADGDGVANRADTCRNGPNGALSGGPPAGFAQSLRDFNNDGVSDITDVGTLGAAFGKNGGSPTAPAGYEGRLDLNYDSAIDITDVGLLGTAFGKRCGPT